MGYVQLSTGFRGGGFSPRPANALQLTSFQPEFIDNFEVGVKTDWLDGRLRFNGDIYYMKNTDKQQGIADCAPCTPTRVNSFPTVNTGESRNWGIEARDPGRADRESADRLLARLPELQGHGSRHARPASSSRYRTRPAIRRFAATCCTRRARRSGTRGSVSSISSKSAARGATLTPRLDYTWQDDIWFTTNPVAGIVNEEDGRQPAYGVLNARVTWDAPDSAGPSPPTRLNLTDEYYFYGKLSLLGNSGREQGNPAPPREVGVNLRFNF